MRLFKACAFAIAVTVLCWQSARADLVITGVSRSVFAAAGPFGTGGGTMSPLPGLFLASTSHTGGAPGEFVEGHASQGSDTPLGIGPSMGGIGDAGGSVFSPSGSYSLTGDSFFSVFFTVTLDGPYLLDADTSWSAPTPPFTGAAFVTLAVDPLVGPDIPIVGIANGPGSPGSSSLTTVVGLFAGTSYHLTAVAHVDAGGLPGTFSGDADWGFTLTSIPESNAWLLTAPIAIGLAIAAWRRRRPLEA